MTSVFEPSSASSAFRANLAGLISPLRRVRTRTPFFRLAAHRIPTLWSLYRGLLRAAPDANIRFRVRILFKKTKGVTSVKRTQDSLRLGYKWLDFFRRAQEGNEHCQRVMMRWSSLVGVKMEKAYMMRHIRMDIEERERLRHRPILTGGFMRPSVNFVGIPRMKPQPPAISHLIIDRIKRRTQRYKRKDALEESISDLELEAQFERGLKQEAGTEFQTFFSEKETQEWKTPMLDMLSDISQTNVREYERANTPFAPEVIERVIEARRQRIRYHTALKDRERRGEETRQAVHRMNKGPPAHILARMTPKQRHMDKVSRSLSEVGYVALVKRRLGFKLKDPEAGLELGEAKNRRLLDDAAQAVYLENARRQRAEEAALNGEGASSGRPNAAKKKP